MSGKRVSNGYASLCVNWKEKRNRLMVNRGAFIAPSATFTNSLHFPALSDTVTIHNSGLSVYYNNLIFIIDFGDDQNAFFSLANVFTFAAAVALALPAKANTWPLPPAGSGLVGENKFHVVENDGGSGSHRQRR